MEDDRGSVEAFSRGPNHGRSEGLPEHLAFMLRPKEFGGSA